MRNRKTTPYVLVLPAWIWLALFFVVPIVGMLSLSLTTGNVVTGFQQTFEVGNYVTAVGTYWEQILRSLFYGGCATLVCIVVGYPMAYWIAFRAGPHKSTYLLLILLPFFVSFVLRTISWRFLLADNGVVLGTLKSVGMLPADAQVLNSAPAVVLGLAYNFLPFMVLPIYAVLERMDPRLVEAAHDLYAGRVQAFVRVILPVSLPGVFAGVLMTFIPTSADYVNASVLGGTHNTMIGNVIQTQYLVNNNYPIAASITFVLMGLLLVGIFSYARALGTERVMEVHT
ncbi:MULTISPECIES: ABC transporter permease [unclassified Nocardiopsis]|jgi:spermidine/putrescine transport system permease protein|uniref:ABC transporter permease n=1 Tax=unclassified Nocardiopsis TaxID=2649073 RepID=UPI00066E1649|nr:MULTISPECIES: ABC transporter permease [unclassified Nocardiopsis]MBQ1083081.1 ABC transporter permease [Nocardiopsis sp. B62]